MPQHIEWETRTARQDPPAPDLTIADLRWLLTEAERMGAGDYTPVHYLRPITVLADGEPDQGWGLKIELDI